MARSLKLWPYKSHKGVLYSNIPITILSHHITLTHDPRFPTTLCSILTTEATYRTNTGPDDCSFA